MGNDNSITQLPYYLFKLTECIRNGKIFGMEIYTFGIEIVVWILLGLFFTIGFFEIDMIMTLRSADHYLWYSWLDMKWFDEFALLFSSRGDFISDT